MKIVCFILVIITIAFANAQYDALSIDVPPPPSLNDEFDFISNAQIGEDVNMGDDMDDYFDDGQQQQQQQVVPPNLPVKEPQQQQTQITKDIPPPPPVDEPIDYEGDGQFEDYEERSRNSAFGRGRRRRRPPVKPVKPVRPTPFDHYDWDKLPGHNQLPGDIVRLRNAPGVVPVLNEETLPKYLLPPKDCKDPNHVNDIKLWRRLTKKIRVTKVTAAKYKRWLKAAKLALAKVRSQIALTEKNSKIVSRAIRGMIEQRRQIVKRLKSYKLKRDLELAKKKMEQLQQYGTQINSVRSSLVEGASDMERKVKLLQRGMEDLQKFGEDV